jgi:hypothetical protein
MSLLGKLKAAKIELEMPEDPWLAPLQRVRGKVEFDGLERVSSQSLLDMLEVPQRSRTAGTYRRLAKQMAELGWTAVRVRDLTRGGYKEQVRGYVRTHTFTSPALAHRNEQSRIPLYRHHSPAVDH